jgi:hypothetical protein
LNWYTFSLTFRISEKKTKEVKEAAKPKRGGRGGARGGRGGKGRGKKKKDSDEEEEEASVAEEEEEEEDSPKKVKTSSCFCRPFVDPQLFSALAAQKKPARGRGRGRGRGAAKASPKPRKKKKDPEEEEDLYAYDDEDSKAEVKAETKSKAKAKKSDLSEVVARSPLFVLLVFCRVMQSSFSLVAPNGMSRRLITLKSITQYTSYLSHPISFFCPLCSCFSFVAVVSTI